jgi:hypothetical protein
MRFTRSLLLAVSAALLANSAIRVGMIEAEGVVRPQSREVTGTVTTAVHTTFGNVPVTGHLHARYRCDATFSGTLRYGRVVRLLARVRGATLVNVAEGRIEMRETWNCLAGPDHFAGNFMLRDSVLTGHLSFRSTSVPVTGSARLDGERTFHIRISAAHPDHAYTVHLTLQER